MVYPVPEYSMKAGISKYNLEAISGGRVSLEDSPVVTLYVAPKPHIIKVLYTKIGSADDTWPSDISSRCKGGLFSGAIHYKVHHQICAGTHSSGFSGAYCPARARRSPRRLAETSASVYAS